jgi:hypothetical protein
MAQGLTQNDEIIRQHLRDKMLAIAENGAELSEPSEDDLRGFYQAHIADFRIEPLISLAQIYLDPQRDPGQTEQRARALLDRLNSGQVERPWELGDQTELPHEMAEYPESDVTLTFGPEFVTSLKGVTQGTWQGPLRSKLGLHLVRLEEWTEARTQPFDEVQEEVKGRWIDQRVADAREKFYAPLRSRYTVVVEQAPAGAATSEPAAVGGS